MKTLILLIASCAAWGQGWYPIAPDWIMAAQALSGSAIDATGEKYAACGTVWTPTGGTKSIDKVGMLFGAVTKAGGSVLTLSLQNVDTATGPPVQPDGTQDQTATLSNASITATTFLLSPSLSAQRSVSYGEQICAVVEFDGAGRLGADSFAFANIGRTPSFPAGYPSAVLNTGAWADSVRSPIIVFEFSDGSYGTLFGAGPYVTYNTSIAYNSSSSPDEYALKFTVPTDGLLTGVHIATAVASGANFDVVLYSGTTSLNSISIDSNAFLAGQGMLAFPSTALSAGTTYYLSVKPTTTNNDTLYLVTVASNAYLGATPQGSGWVRSSRTDAGAWSDTNTTLPSIRFLFTPTAATSTAGGAFAIAQ